MYDVIQMRTIAKTDDRREKERFLYDFVRICMILCDLETFYTKS